MADTFFEDTKKELEQVELPDKIKLGEREYSQDELTKLVDLGSRASEIEKNHGSLDNFVTDYGRTKNKVGAYEKELEELRAKAEATQFPSEFTEEQKKNAQDQLSKLLGGQPLTRQEMESWYVNRRQAEKLLDEMEDLSEKIDGSDGRPKFDTSAVLSYMEQNGTKKPLLAYKEMYEKELEEWKQNELAKAKPQGIYSEEETAAIKEPKDVRPSADNLDALLKEALYSNNK